MFSSTVIPTVNRETLSRAVCSVLEQKFNAADFEVIIVNDSGHQLPDMDWHRSPRVRIINTNRRERSVARNTGAAIARGKYLHFLDDDDWIVPGALELFWRLDQISESVWLYGSYQTVDNEGKVLEEIHPGIQGNISAWLIAGESLPLQASFLEAKQFHAIGGFDPLVIGVEDRDLGRRLALTGSVAYARTVVAEIRVGEEGSTTNWATLAETDRCGREKALALQGVPAKLRRAANSSYIRGRICRAYLASIVWNLEKRRLFTAASRAVTAISFTGLGLLSSSFWRGIRSIR